MVTAAADRIFLCASLIRCCQWFDLTQFLLVHITKRRASKRLLECAKFALSASTLSLRQATVA
jgi:hypothetical protein